MFYPYLVLTRDLWLDLRKWIVRATLVWMGPRKGIFDKCGNMVTKDDSLIIPSEVSVLEENKDGFIFFKCPHVE